MYACPISELHESKYYSITKIGHGYESFSSTNCRLEKIGNRNIPKFSNFPFESRLISSYPFYDYLDSMSISDDEFSGHAISKTITRQRNHWLEDELIPKPGIIWER